MNVLICDRCGDVVVDGDPCRCTTPHDLMAVLRRHREALARAQTRTSANKHTRRGLDPKKAA